MSDLNNILKDIKAKKFAPVYFLYGDDSFFIDQISNAIEQTALDEAEKSFNQTIFYGKDAKVEEILECAKRFPMMAAYQVVIVKEAQHLSKKMGMLEQYMESPSSTTILVFCSKGKKPDGRLKVFKNMKKVAVMFESKPLYDNKIPGWINEHVKSLGYSIDPKACQMLVEFIGNDLSRISNEIKKLTIIHEPSQPITPQSIEENIGFSKDFNNFELRKAIGQRDGVKVHRIINYFAENPKDNPIVLTTSQLYSYFVQLLIVHSLQDQSPDSISRATGVHRFFTNELIQAIRNYNMKKCSAAIGLIKQLDLKSKGVGVDKTSSNDVLREVIVKIMA